MVNMKGGGFSRLSNGLKTMDIVISFGRKIHTPSLDGRVGPTLDLQHFSVAF